MKFVLNTIHSARNAVRFLIDAIISILNRDQHSHPPAQEGPIILNALNLGGQSIDAHTEDISIAPNSAWSGPGASRAIPYAFELKYRVEEQEPGSLAPSLKVRLLIYRVSEPDILLVDHKFGSVKAGETVHGDGQISLQAGVRTSLVVEVKVEGRSYDPKHVQELTVLVEAVSLQGNINIGTNPVTG